MPFGQSLPGDCPNCIIEPYGRVVDKSVENFGRKCKKVENYSYFCIN